MTTQTPNEDLYSAEGDFSLGFMDDSPYATLVKEIAKECVDNMTEKEKESFCKDPCITRHHFGYGLYIRNTYYKRFEEAGVMLAFRDRMSRDVLREIRSILMPDYIPPDE